MADRERHPHDVHALPDRRRLPRQARSGQRRRAAGPVGASAARGRGPGWSRSSVARTACSSCRPARSSAAGPRSATASRSIRPRRRTASARRRRPAISTVPGRWRRRSAGDHVGVPTLARLTSAALDLAFPAACSGCGREGAPLCEACVPALDARLGLPGGTPIGLPADLPAPLLQLDWCAPFAGPVRRALHDLKYAGERRLAEPLGAAVARRWARVGVGAGGRRPGPRPCRPRADPRLRPGRAHRRGRRATRSGLPLAVALERGRARPSRSSSSVATSAPRMSRAPSACGGANRPPPVRSSPGAGSCSSTTW